MRRIDRDRYPEATRGLIAAAFAQGLPRALAFGRPEAAARAALAAIDAEALGGARPARDPDGVIGLRAGLWLLHDFMDEAHALAQRIEETVSGAYWHAILHRREPDAGNARYWFARVGEHPVFPELLADAREIAGDEPPPPLAPLLRADAWRPGRFVELATGRGGGAAEPLLLAIERREWELLFDHEWRRVFGA